MAANTTAWSSTPATHPPTREPSLLPVAPLHRTAAGCLRPATAGGVQRLRERPAQRHTKAVIGPCLWEVEPVPNLVATRDQGCMDRWNLKRLLSDGQVPVILYSSTAALT